MPPADDRAPRARAYWKKNRRLIATLLTVWAVVSYGCSILFVEELNRFTIGALPLGFWFSQQGSIYVFVVLVFVYAFAMDRLDRQYAMGGEAEAPGGIAGAGPAQSTGEAGGEESVDDV